MIRKLFILVLCLMISGCIGFNSAAGLKFKTGNEVVKLKNGTFIDFERPIGNCGVRTTFFGIILPIIPILFNSNSCEKSFDVAFTSIVNDLQLEQKVNIKLKYNGFIYDPVSVEKLIESYYVQKGEKKLQYGRKFKFKIENFSKFKNANDKAVIVIGKTKDGKEFTEEFPVKWGIMLYKNPNLPW